MDIERQEIFNNGTAVVYYLPEYKLVENVWQKKVALDSEAYRKPFLAALEFVKEKPVVYYLSDIRNQGVVPVSEKNWFRTVAFPQAAAAGVKYGAVVTYANIFKIYYMNAIIKVGNVFNLPVKTFSDWQKAFDWLVGQKVH
jgi:hypothetical protein